MSLVPLTLHAARGILALTREVRAHLAVPVVPGVNDASSETREQVAAQRAAALHALALRGVSESDHALAVKALGEIEYHARALAVILAPGSVPSGAAARVTAPGSVA